MHVDNTCVLGVWCHVQDRRTNLFMRRVYYYGGEGCILFGECMVCGLKGHVPIWCMLCRCLIMHVVWRVICV